MTEQIDLEAVPLGDTLQLSTDAAPRASPAPSTTVVSARDLRWGDAGQTRLDATVRLDHIPVEIPFTGDDRDEAPHVQDFMVRARAGEFGPITPYEPPQAAPAPVPASLTPRQARKVLRLLGLKTAVDAYIAALPEEEQEEWEYTLEVRRDNPILAAGWDALGRTQSELDDLFRLGATL